MKNKIKILVLLVLALFTTLSLASCNKVSYDTGLALYKDKLESLYTEEIEYTSCTYIYTRITITSEEEPKEVRNYYYELEYKITNTKETVYFVYNFSDSTIEDITEEEYQYQYKMVNTGKLDGKIVKLY